MPNKTAAKSGALYRPKRYYQNMTAEKAMEIRSVYVATRCKQKDLAVQYGVSQSTVCRIISGEVW
jgi:DNA-binding transcriptional regulator LsrR (DeoR family)